MIVKLYINNRRVLESHPNFWLLSISGKLFIIVFIHELLLVFRS